AGGRPRRRRRTRAAPTRPALRRPSCCGTRRSPLSSLVDPPDGPPQGRGGNPFARDGRTTRLARSPNRHTGHEAPIGVGFGKLEESQTVPRHRTGDPNLSPRGSARTLVVVSVRFFSR